MGKPRILDSFLRERSIRHLNDEPLAGHTTFRIGGPARRFVLPGSIAEVRAVWNECREREIPVRILGSGANLLVPDSGYEGVVINLRHMNRVDRSDDSVRAEAGVSFPRLVMQTVRAGLQGFEGLGGIPANVGGAVFMNAGGRHGEIFDIIRSVETLDADGELREIPKDEIPFQYRRSGLDGHIILAATFDVQEENPKALKERFEWFVLRKRKTQPMRQKCAGCIFKNPAGMSAGRAIDMSGMKGASFGGAMVSAKHANFIVNRGEARADDVLHLIDHVRSAVRANLGLDLNLEVLVW